MCSHSEADVLLKINQNSCLSFTKAIIIPFEKCSDFYRQLLSILLFYQEKLREICLKS
jgi:hypothetical protein